MSPAYNCHKSGQPGLSWEANLALMLTLCVSRALGSGPPALALDEAASMHLAHST